MAQYQIKEESETMRAYEELAMYSFNYRLWQNNWERSLSSHDQQEMDKWKAKLDTWLKDNLKKLK